MAPPPPKLVDASDSEQEARNNEVVDESFGVRSSESKPSQSDRNLNHRPRPRPPSSSSSSSSCFSSCSPDTDEVSSFRARNGRNAEGNGRNIEGNARGTGEASASRYSTQNAAVPREMGRHDQNTTRWTNDKHSAYLNNREATFVQQMYDNEYCSFELCGKKPAK